MRLFKAVHSALFKPRFEGKLQVEINSLLNLRLPESALSLGSRQGRQPTHWCGRKRFTLSLSARLLARGQVRGREAAVWPGALAVPPRAVPDSGAHSLGPRSLRLHEFFIERVSQNGSPFWLLLKWQLARSLRGQRGKRIFRSGDGNLLSSLFTRQTEMGSRHRRTHRAWLQRTECQEWGRLSNLSGTWFSYQENGAMACSCITESVGKILRIPVMGLEVGEQV